MKTYNLYLPIWKILQDFFHYQNILTNFAIDHHRMLHSYSFESVMKEK